MQNVCPEYLYGSSFEAFFCSIGDYSKIWFFDLFIQQWVPFLLSAGIFGLLILAIIYYQLKVSPLSRELSNTQLFLNRKSSGNNAYDKRKSFLENYNEINEFFEKTKFLKYAWNEFSETLITPHKDDAQRDIRNSEHSEKFFYQEALFDEAKIRSQYVNFIPSFFISFGLLLTFIGLVAALMKTGEAFGVESNTDQMMNSLRDLLSAATFKFTTSIAGIASALVFSTYSRIFIYSAQSVKINNICSIFEKSLRFESVEKLTISLIEQNKQQTTVFEDFGENFATALGDKLSPIHNELQNMAGQFGQMNQDALSNMIDTFQNNLTSGSQEMMKNLAENLLEVSNKIEGVSSSMTNSGEQFNTQLSKATDNLITSIEDINQKINSQGETFEKISELTKNAADSIENSTKSFVQISGPLEEISEKMQTSLSNISETIGKLSELQEGMNSTVEAINTATSTMQNTWNDYQNRFEGIDESFTKSVETFGKFMNANQQNAQEFVKEIEIQFNSSAQTLSSVITQLQDTVEELEFKLTNANKQEVEENNQN